MLVHLEQPTAGAIRYKGEDITKLSGRALKAVRRNIQMVFQDPYTSLNPRMTVGDIIGEPYEIHPEVAPKGDRRRKVQDLLDVVGLNPEYINRYPHQFSGGQRQRIGIARGLALQPGDHRGRRAGLRAGRLGAGAGHQPAGAGCRTSSTCRYVFIAHDLSDRAAHLRPGRRDVPGPDRGDRHRTRRSTTTPPTRTPRRCCPRSRCRTRRRASTGERIILHGDVPSPGEPALGLPLPHPLLEGAGAVRAGGAAAGGPGGLPAARRGPADARRRRATRGGEAASCRRRRSRAGRVGAARSPGRADRAGAPFGAVALRRLRPDARDDVLDRGAAPGPGSRVLAARAVVGSSGKWQAVRWPVAVARRAAPAAAPRSRTCPAPSSSGCGSGSRTAG